FAPLPSQRPQVGLDGGAQGGVVHVAQPCGGALHQRQGADEQLLAQRRLGLPGGLPQAADLGPHAGHLPRRLPAPLSLLLLPPPRRSSPPPPPPRAAPPPPPPPPPHRPPPHKPRQPPAPLHEAPRPRRQRLGARPDRLAGQPAFHLLCQLLGVLIAFRRQRRH